MRPTLIALLALGACSSQPPLGANVAQTEVTNVTDDASPAPIDKTPIPAGAAKPVPAPGMVNEGRVPEDSPQAAAHVVESYYALLDAGRYDHAYALWKPGAAGMGREAFAASFAGYRDYHAKIGAPSDVEGAAGSRYVTVPVRVYGTLGAGGPFDMRGSVTLSRAVVDGATAEQRRWRISGSDIKPRPGEGQPSPTADSRADVRFRCMDGVRIVARFDPDKEEVTVTRAGRTITLPQQRTGSGIRYSDGRTTFEGKGDDMAFEAPGQPPIACTVIRR